MFSSMLSLLGSLRGGSSFITNSLRFRSSASAYLSRTTSGTGSNTTATISFWVKRGSLGSTQALFGSTQSPGADGLTVWFDSLDRLNFQINASGGPTNGQLITTQIFRDPSAWYHIVCVADTANATASNRMLMYVNGVQVTSFSTNTNPTLNSTIWLGTSGLTNFIGRVSSSAIWFFDGYLTEYNVINGQALTPASFGAIDSSTGVWAPRPYSGTYGTNGFYLKFADASAATAAAIGKDSSGNGNNWTPSGISVTAGATYDSMIDVPVNYSDGGNGRGNYAVLNPLLGSSFTGPLDGNLSVGFNANQGRKATIAVSSGKWYWECSFVTPFLDSVIVGVCRPADVDVFTLSATGYGYLSVGLKANSGSGVAYGAAFGLADTIGIAFNADAGTIEFYKNNVSQGVAYTGLSGEFVPAFCTNGSGSTNFRPNFGQRPFAYTPPAGFRALNTNNLPTPSIVNGANFMAATTYTGNAAARSLSNAVNSVSFQPDLVWIKSRTPGATSHALFDSVRGTTKYLSSNTTTAETTLAQSLTAFGADGFSLGTDTTLVNANANSYVAWQWKAGGAAVSNTQGTITSQVSANTTAGFSVVTYTGTGANATVGHGLGVAPKMVIVKQRSATAASWVIWQSTLLATEFLQFDTTAKQTATNVWNSAIPTSSIFSIGPNVALNTNGNNYVAYCFAQIAGFSRFGSYTGNGSANGPFVFCGFRPRWVMIKRTDVANDWIIVDTTRNINNVTNNQLAANDARTELSNVAFDLTSSGFKVRDSLPYCNALNGTYIFAAFAEVPSKYALAR